MYEQQTAAIVRRHSHVSWRLIGAYAIAALAVGIGMACLLLLLSYKHVVGDQMAQMSQAIESEHSERVGDYNSLNGKYSGMAGIEAAIARYGMVCSQYLTGPSGGPETFFFPCTDVKSGS